MSLKCTEKQVQKAISDYLSARSIIHRRTNSGGMKIANRYIRFMYWLYPVGTIRRGYDEYAFLDIDGILPDGRAFFVECKATGKEPTIEQWNTIRLICGTPAIAMWADSIDMFIEKFEGIISF